LRDGVGHFPTFFLEKLLPPPLLLLLLRLPPCLLLDKFTCRCPPIVLTNHIL